MTQTEALDILKMGHNVFLTGPAGSGKTYVLNEFIKFLKAKDVEVGITASTGIAASHMGGMTIHAWSGLGVRNTLTAYDLEDMEEKTYLWKRFEKAKVLIIDEISMLHHFRLDLVEQLCRLFKRSEEPFGGLQVVLCGDFFQLPPVSRADEQDAFFAYHSPAWKKLNPKICYLEEQHRSHDRTYLKILNAIRSGMISEDIRNHLSSRFNKTGELSFEPTKLYSHNANVDEENERELNKLPGQVFEYGMQSKGRPALIDTLKKSCLAPDILRIKKGARVMFVKNNYDLGYVNGTLGIVTHCDDNGITVRTASGDTIDVPLAGWEIEEEGKIKAEIVQFPLRLAWAITVHKSQGMSLDAAEVDLSRSFEPGMGYVALSRVRSLAGLSLLGINDTALKVNEEALLFDEKFSEISERDAAAFRKLSASDIKKRQEQYLEKIAPKTTGKKAKIKKLPTHEETKKLIEEGNGLKDIIRLRGLTTGTVISHCEKVKEEYPYYNFQDFVRNSGLSVLKIQKIRAALSRCGTENGKYSLTSAKDTLGSGFSFDEIRLVRLMM